MKYDMIPISKEDMEKWESLGASRNPEPKGMSQEKMDELDRWMRSKLRLTPGK